MVGILVGGKAKIKEGECAGILGRVISYDSSTDMVELSVDKFTIILTRRANIEQNLHNDEITNVAGTVYKQRILGGFEYAKCPTCKTEFEIKHPIEIELPYCSECGRIVLDSDQIYCCWCGKKFA